MLSLHPHHKDGDAMHSNRMTDTQWVSDKTQKHRGDKNVTKRLSYNNTATFVQIKLVLIGVGGGGSLLITEVHCKHNGPMEFSVRSQISLLLVNITV
jgi:hypothetical protein